MKRLLLAILPGAENWLWRRVSLLGSVGTLLWCLVTATLRSDSATVAQLVIGLVGVLGIYTAGGVTDDHLKRKTEAEHAI